MQIVSVALQGILTFSQSLQKNTFKVRLRADHYTTPQMVVLLDPKTMSAVDLKDVGVGQFMQTVNQYGGTRGPASVGLKGYGGIGDGQETVTTAELVFNFLILPALVFVFSHTPQIAVKLLLVGNKRRCFVFNTSWTCIIQLTMGRILCEQLELALH